MTPSAIEALSQGNNELLLVIPHVCQGFDEDLEIDSDFANNLTAYLRNFERVTVLSPHYAKAGNFPGTRPKHTIEGHERLDVIPIPEAYREDRYLFHRRSVGRLLEYHLRRARYRLISPHAPFDWSGLAAEICVREKLPFNMEADWNLPEVSRFLVSRQTSPIQRFRKRLWFAYYNRKYWHWLRNSRVSLVQGSDVYNEYKDIAPNCHSVLNVQVTDKDKISEADLERKLSDALSRDKLDLFYAGRAIDIKGPEFWIRALAKAKEDGARFNATWVGEGERLEEMRALAKNLGLADDCSFPGKVEKTEVRERLAQADFFLFCHMTKESPRCLVESLAAGTPIVGFGTDYSRSLVAKLGGGLFVERGDIDGLAALISSLFDDRQKLRDLIANAALSGASRDRESAIQERIELMKRYL